MKFKVFNEPEESKEKEVTLALRDTGDGEVSVVAVDADGDIVMGGYLCKFRTNRRLMLNENVNTDLGFDLDGDGAIEAEVEN